MSRHSSPTRIGTRSTLTAGCLRRISYWLLVCTAIFSLFFSASAGRAAMLHNLPLNIKQPDGTVIHVFADGDEYFHWLHDQNNFAIVQNPTTRYYVYASQAADGTLSATSAVVGRDNPAAAGVVPGHRVSVQRYQQLKAASPLLRSSRPFRAAPTTGSFNNLVIFVRFSDESASNWLSSPSQYNSWFNDTGPAATSLQQYYWQASYQQLRITSVLYPKQSGGTVVSYQDTHPRAYYEPQSNANPIGYSTADDAGMREQTMLANALIAIAPQISSNINLDSDGDGVVDSVDFIIDGDPGGWSDLLWPHMWQFGYATPPQINGKTVDKYDFQIDGVLGDNGSGQNTNEGSSVLCHEMFHTLGAPDLYHYTMETTPLQWCAGDPVGGWDLMCMNKTPVPQHMTAYLKYRIGHWISTIPTITKSGTYTLNPLSSSTNNCYKIPSTYAANQYFMVEYRDANGATSDQFENGLPSSGLLVYRIDENVPYDLNDGNKNGPPDLLYVYRTDGTAVNENVASYPDEANLITAPLNSAGRTAINDNTNPSSFIYTGPQGGPGTGAAGGLNISNVSAAGSTISFTVTLPGGSTTQGSQPDLMIRNAGSTGWTGQGVIYNGTNQAAETVNQSVAAGSTTTYQLQVQNTSSSTDSFSIAANPSSQTGVSYKFFNALTGGNDITSQITGTGGYTISSLPPNATINFRVEISISAQIAVGTIVSLPVTTASTGDATKSDEVWSVTTVNQAANTYKPDLMIRNAGGTTWVGQNVIDATGATEQVSQLISGGATAVYQLQVQNSGSTADTMKLTAPAPDPNWTIHYFDALTGGNDITSQLTGGGYTTASLPKDSNFAFRLEVTPTAQTTTNTPEAITVTAASTTQASTTDAVIASTTVPPLTSVTLLSETPPSPGLANQTVTLTAQAVGGMNLQYQFLVGSTIIRPFAASATTTWTPTTPGSYQLTVVAKDVTNSTVTSPAVTYVVNPALTSVAISSITPSSPCPVQSPIIITASATGGSNVVYQFMANSSVIRDFAASTTCVWIPSVPNNYSITVNAKDLNASPSPTFTSAAVNYTVTTALSGVSLQLPNGQRGLINKPVSLQAVATGGAKVVYQFLQGPTAFRDFSPSATATWTPTAVGNYTLFAVAKDLNQTTGTSTMTSMPVTFAAVAPLSQVSFVGIVPNSPRTVNAPVNIVASATGGVNPQFKFLIGSTVYQDFSASSSCSWIPTTPGVYTLSVVAKDAGGDDPNLLFNGATAQSYTITPALSGVTVTTAQPSPTPVKQTVTWQATGLGGANVVYKFTLNGQVLQDYSSAGSCQWMPIAPGTYTMSVSAKDLNGVDQNAVVVSPTVTYAVTTPLSQVSLLATTPATPTVLGNSITLTAQATGGADVRYQFLAGNTIIRDFAPNPTATWNPGTAGAYSLTVVAQDNNDQNGPASAVTSSPVAYTIAPPLTGAQLSGALLSVPRPVGYPIPLTATATGGAKVLYQFVVGSGTVLRDFDASPTFTWNPGTASTYSLTVVAKDTNGTNSNATVVSSPLSATITPAMTVVSLAITPCSPAPLNQPITVTAQTDGGANLVYQFQSGTTNYGDFTAVPTLKLNPTSAGTYPVRVVAKDLNAPSGQTTLYSPFTNIYATDVTLSLPSGLSMVALPLVPAAGDPQTVLGFNNNRWARWDPSMTTTSKFRYYPDTFTQFDANTPGKAYWVMVDRASTFIPVSGQPLAPQTIYTIPLSIGWNMIGNPWLAPMTWDTSAIRVQQLGTIQSVTLAEAKQLGWVDDYAWCWQNSNGKSGYQLLSSQPSSTYTTNTLAPWRGCWIDAKIAVNLLLPEPTSVKQSMPAPVTPAPSDAWQIQLAATRGAHAAGTLVIGDTATSQAFTVGLPPNDPLNTGLRVFSQSGSTPLAFDIHAGLPGHQQWDFVIDCPATDGATADDLVLRWPDLTAAPADMSLVLVNLDNGDRRYLRTTSDYAIPATGASGVHRFRLLADRNRATAIAITGLRAEAMRGSRSQQITFTLQQASQTTLTIRSMTGMLVRTLEVNTPRQAGAQSITWDGCDAAGRPVPRGVYLLDVRAIDDVNRQVRASITVNVE